MSPNSTVLMDVECDEQLEVEDEPGWIVDCGFFGEALVTVHYDTGRWTCPICDAEHQIEGLADLGEPDPDLARKP